MLQVFCVICLTSSLMNQANTVNHTLGTGETTHNCSPLSGTDFKLKESQSAQ